MPRLPRAAVLVLVLASAACAPATGSSTPPERSRNASVITQEDVARAGGGTAYDIVQSLRPAWLRLRDTRANVGEAAGVVVYMDNARLGGVEALRQVPAADIATIRHFDPPAADFRFGAGHSNGAIQVVTHGAAATIRGED